MIDAPINVHIEEVVLSLPGAVLARVHVAAPDGPSYNIMVAPMMVAIVNQVAMAVFDWRRGSLPLPEYALKPTVTATIQLSQAVP